MHASVQYAPAGIDGVDGDEEDKDDEHIFHAVVAAAHHVTGLGLTRHDTTRHGSGNKTRVSE